MAGFIGEEQVRRIKEAIELADVMADYTTLKQSGVNFTGCCPFHHERTPSMYVYADDQHYHCFGCGVHGDVVSLIQEKEGLDFLGAMEWLARRAGVEIEYEKTGRQEPAMQKSERQRYIDVMEAATAFFENELWTSEHARAAREYLQVRGLSMPVNKSFRLGWAPGRDAMTKHLQSYGFTTEDLKLLDITVESERGIQDRFRQRLMFPVCDRFGHVVAFSGRLLPETEKKFKEQGIGVGKYINSRDTPLYHKSNIVFNLHLARPAAREVKRIIVMEGPTDVMAAHQQGIKECVAVLGTALTMQHAKQISQSVGHEGRVILLFDGDAAGQKNSIRAVKTCMQSGVSSQAAILPEGDDPAELLNKEAASGLEKVLLGRQNDIDYLLRHLAPRPYELDSRQQLAVIDELLAVLRDIQDEGLRDAFVNDMAIYLNVDEHKLKRRMQQGVNAPTRGVEYVEDEGEQELVELSSEQRHIVGILLSNLDLRDPAFDEFGCEPNDFPLPWRHVVNLMSLNHDMDTEALVAAPVLALDSQLRQAVLALSHEYKDQAVQIMELQEVMDRVQRRRCEARVRELEFKLKQAQQDQRHDEVKELFAELFEMTNEMRRLSGHEGAREA